MNIKEHTNAAGSLETLSTKSESQSSPAKSVTQTQVIKLQKISRSKIEAIGDFATGLAHELNQPMTFINSVFDYLNMRIDRGRLDPKRAKELIGTAKKRDSES